MDSGKQQLIDKLKSSNNVLVTVSRSPSVDQLAALLGLSLIINKQGKHCAAVFSGNIPSTIEFLKPEATIEKTTDSLRDFIIALDKNKADKLRYKVEDNIVRIFITPYKTSITESDLEFSQGDFNVDLLIALGVKEQSELDEAITAHGRILHDAAVASVNLDGKGDLGGIKWTAAGASSLSEAVTDIAKDLGEKLIDSQIATALLTGIVSETDRFRNEKTSPQTMSLSSVLMKAGANQQLIASKLEEPKEPEKLASDQPTPPDLTQGKSQDNGTLEIAHSDTPVGAGENNLPTEAPEPEISSDSPDNDNSLSHLTPGAKIVTEPPTLGGNLTANTMQNIPEPSTDPLSVPNTEPPTILEQKAPRVTPIKDQPQPAQPEPTAVPTLDNLTMPTYSPPPAEWSPPDNQDSDQVKAPQLHIDEEGTLTQLEEKVHSPHIEEEKNPQDTDMARTAVDEALKSTTPAIDPSIEGLNANPIIDNLHANPSQQINSTPSAPPVPPPIYNPPSQN